MLESPRNGNGGRASEIPQPPQKKKGQGDPDVRFMNRVEGS